MFGAAGSGAEWEAPLDVPDILVWCCRFGRRRTEFCTAQLSVLHSAGHYTAFCAAQRSVARTALCTTQRSVLHSEHTILYGTALCLSLIHI